MVDRSSNPVAELEATVQVRATKVRVVRDPTADQRALSSVIRLSNGEFVASRELAIESRRPVSVRFRDTEHLEIVSTPVVLRRWDGYRWTYLSYVPANQVSVSGLVVRLHDRRPEVPTVVGSLRHEKGSGWLFLRSDGDPQGTILAAEFPERDFALVARRDG